MTELEFQFLCACRDSVRRQAELVPVLAVALGVPSEQVFYHWAITRCKQSGRIAGTDWKYFFHGLECDLVNARDNRFLRIDFAPGGRFDSFSAYGVMQYVLTAAHPWKVYPELRGYLSDPRKVASADGAVKPAHLSGSHAKLDSLCGFLGEYVEKADNPLAEPEPPEGWRLDQPGAWDGMIRHRIRLSAKGMKRIDEGWPGSPQGAEP